MNYKEYVLYSKTNRFFTHDDEVLFESINEGVVDNIYNALLPIIKSIMDNMKKYAAKAVDLIGKLFNKLKGVMDKNPIIFKAAVFFLVLCLVCISTTASASNPELGKTICNTALGMLDSLSDDKVKISVILEAKAYFINMRDHLGVPEKNFSKESVDLANSMIALMKKMSQENHYSFLEQLSKLGEKLYMNSFNITDTTKNINIGYH